MSRVVLSVALFVLAGCTPHPPNVKDRGTGGGGSGSDDTAEACGECTLINCENPDEPDVSTELDCEDAASDQGCEDWEFDPC